MSSITPIGITDWRNIHQAFGIKDKDRLGHIYVIGKTGVGKSTLLLNMAISDIERGNGICIVDPHGDIAETILHYVPASRIQDVIYFNPGDTDYPIAFNPLADINPREHHLVAAGLIAALKKIWSENWGPRLEYILRFSLLTLLSYPDATLLDIQPLLTNAFFRSQVLTYVTDPPILAFWQNEYEKYPPALRAEAIAPILNKTGLFLASMPLRNSMGQQRMTFSLLSVLDDKKILICNLSKGVIGEDASALFGSMLVTAIQLAALKRAAIPEQDRIPFYLYVDEMHSFVSLSFADILSEARKYGLSLFLTHQYIEQLHEKIRAAIFGNVGTIISFKVGAEDALTLEKEFHPIFSADDFINLPRYAIYLKLLIDGTTPKPFSANTHALPAYAKSYKENIIKASREIYGSPVEVVQNAIAKRYRAYQQNPDQSHQLKLFT